MSFKSDITFKGLDFFIKSYFLNILFVFITLNLIALSKALHIEKLEMPDSLKNGSTNIPLQCIYRLDSTREKLYSIKWYKNNVEFYRYLPSDELQPGQFFNLKGIYLNMKQCNATHVTLKQTDLFSEGTYSCEVSTDNFITATALKQLKIYYLPNEKNRIEGSKFEYEINHPISLTCLSSPSKPPMKLYWYINNRIASSKYLVPYPNETLSNNLVVTKLGLNFKPNSRHFKPDGFLRLNCLADLKLDYSFETAQYLDNAKNKIANGHYTQNELFLPQKETPVITGGKTTYRVGDTLNLTCTTISTNAQLQWFINDEPVVSSSDLKSYSNKNLGLTMILEKHHFQSDLKFKCVSRFSKQIAQFTDQVAFATQNAELFSSSISSSNTMFIKNKIKIFLFLIFFCLNFSFKKKF